MIGQQLQGNHRHQRLKRFDDVRDVEDGLAEPGDVLIAFGRDRDDVTSATPDLFDVRHDLLVLAVPGRDEHHGHPVVDECDRTVLHLRGRHAFRVDVADLLELERAFHRHGVVHTTPEEEPVLPTDESRRRVSNRITLLENAFDLVWNRRHLIEKRGDLILREKASSTDERREKRIHHHLAHEGLGTGDADLGSDSQIDTGVGLAGDRGSDDVHHAQTHGPLLTSFLHGRQRVGGLAGLTDRDDHGPLFDDRISIAELAGELDVGGNLRKILHEVLADHRGVQGGPLPDEDDPFRSREFTAEVVDAAENDLPCAVVDPALDAGSQRPRLLEDLLEHVVLVIAEFDLLDLDFELVNLRGDFDVVDGRGPEGIAGQLRDGVVVEREGLVGMRHDRALVGGDDVLVVADADQQWRTLAGDHHDARLFLADRRDGVGAFHFSKSALDGLFKVAVIQLADQVDEDFGVGLTVEDVTLFGEPDSQ